MKCVTMFVIGSMTIKVSPRTRDLPKGKLPVFILEV